MTGPPDSDLARAAGRLLARVAHDLNNVAMIWTGHLDLLRGGHESPEEAFGAFDAALEHVRRLAEGLKNLGLLGLEPKAGVDLNEAVREAAASPLSGRPVALDLAPSAPRLFGRRGDLVRAVEALLANAREASSPGAVTRVRTRRSSGENRVTVEVEDSGPGLAPEVIRRDFEPLVSTRGQRGRGLGLALARLVALQHGGTLDLANHPDGGVRARISLPVG